VVRDVFVGEMENGIFREDFDFVSIVYHHGIFPVVKSPLTVVVLSRNHLCLLDYFFPVLC
jgi:hypothetical protein